MKSIAVVALDPVRDDVQAAYEYFEEQSPGGGDAFLTRQFETADRISPNPESFSVKFADYRRAFVPKSNIAVYDFIAPPRAVIVAVIDARRNPRLIQALVRRRRRAR